MSTNIQHALARPERLTVPAQTKVTPSEHDRLKALVDALSAEGYQVSVSSLVRSFIVTGLEAYEAELGVEQRSHGG